MMMIVDDDGEEEDTEGSKSYFYNTYILLNMLNLNLYIQLRTVLEFAHQKCCGIKSLVELGSYRANFKNTLKDSS